MIAMLFGPTPAALDDLIWVADDLTLMDALNQEAATFWALDMETADPDPDLTHAAAMAEMFDGVIVGHKPPPDQGDLVY